MSTGFPGANEASFPDGVSFPDDLSALDGSEFPDDVSALGREDCDEVIGHVTEFLRSEMTDADARDLRANVAEVAPGLGHAEVEEIMRVIMRRSCCERAPESLRLRISTQIAVWRVEG